MEQLLPVFICFHMFLCEFNFCRNFNFNNDVAGRRQLGWLSEDEGTNGEWSQLLEVTNIIQYSTSSTARGGGGSFRIGNL